MNEFAIETVSIVAEYHSTHGHDLSPNNMGVFFVSLQLIIRIIKAMSVYVTYRQTSNISRTLIGN